MNTIEQLKEELLSEFEEKFTVRDRTVVEDEMTPYDALKKDKQRQREWLSTAFDKLLEVARKEAIEEALSVVDGLESERYGIINADALRTKLEELKKEV